ncbi:MAG TPA: hypothetical protein VHL14_07360, partial [Steroidobacteraceae bacterium]|nr:hypothetical protein [Steroidobacteraceae bacterium]
MSYRRYILIVLITFIALVGIREGYARFRLVSCWSGGYEQNAWMAYCNSDRYGVYDVEAVWFEIEQDVADGIRRAKVLTLSDSHLQNALSLGGASEWFSSHHYPVYMLGLPTAESGFGERLVDKFDPHPAVVIFDASPYFTGKMGRFEQILLDDPEGEHRRVSSLHEYQAFHSDFCSRWEWICGRNFSYFRSREDGHWIFPEQSEHFLIGKAGIPNDATRFATSVRPEELSERYPDYLNTAREFIRKLGLPAGCIVITAVPSEAPKENFARYLANNLGLTLVDPDLKDLSTFDRSHLTPESSVRWTQAFLEKLEPVLERCNAVDATVRRR